MIETVIAAPGGLHYAKCEFRAGPCAICGEQIELYERKLIKIDDESLVHPGHLHDWAGYAMQYD